ncbi:MAG: hypothetical protein U1F11_06675 [Steroidobacteraceae bacterium]
MKLQQLARRFAIASAVVPAVAGVAIGAHFAPVPGGPGDELRAALGPLLAATAVTVACYIGGVASCIARLLRESFPTRASEVIEVCLVLTPWWFLPLALSYSQVM